VVKTGGGRFNLKPVIRTSLEAMGGSMKGYVLPNSMATAVYAIQGTDTITGTYTVNGAYLLKGLAAGSYTLGFAPTDASYQKQSKSGIMVTTNNVTVVDTVG
jgi:hypothetical protein